MIRVLIVEDDPMVSMISKKYIENNQGFQVVSICKDEEEALSYLKKHRVDLAILDVYLPKGSGVNLLNEIRKLGLDIDIIMVTASSEIEVLNSALKYGVVDYLVKPFEFARMKSALEKYMLRRKVLESKDKIEQEQIDKVFNKSPVEENKVPKGLNYYTLRIISQFINEHSSESFSADDMSQKLNLSRVTIRRYMDYLEGTGDIVKEIEYGTVGRPIYMYRKNI